jgi:NADH-quinone oxidoreductase subunit M
MGTYGFLRFCLPLFPYASHEAVSLVCFLAVAGIIYGALMALVQSDIKKLVAYSSVSHLGFIILGIFAFNLQGIKGGIIQMINHGLSTGSLFLMVGMIYDRRHTREISEYGGLAQQIPIYATFFLIVTLSSMALPGLNGFVGEFLILVGAFKFTKVYAGIAVIGVVLGASYLLWTYQRMMFKDLSTENKKVTDLDKREIAIMLPMLLFIVWIGINPKPFLSKMDATVNHLITQVEEGRQKGKISKKGPQKSIYDLLTGKKEKK